MSDWNTESPASDITDNMNMAVDNSSTPVEQMPQLPPEPSLEFPTRDFLDKNLRKPDLQKRCLELGITNIWTRKTDLIDMILNKSPPLPSSSEASEAPQQYTTSSNITQPATPLTLTTQTSLHDNITEMNMQEITKSIKTLMSKLEVKDKEIDLLSTEMKTADATIEVLQKRVGTERQ